MQDQPNKVRNEDDRRSERAVVLQLLHEDHDARWSRSELQDELSHIEVPCIECALESLKEAGVVHVQGGQVWASDAARRLDELDLIAV